ncbi:MAG TPA: histidine kinase [Terriglobales bacterium]|nr:histidine kinase [Terriglobales bacterium]
MEHVLALSRLCLALMSLAAWVFRLGDTPARYQLGLSLLLAYVGSSLLLLLWIQIRWSDREPGANFAVWAQVLDIGWPAVICFSVETQNSFYFIIFLFAIIASAFRWGFLETLATGMISAAALLFQAVMVAHGLNILPRWVFAPIEPSRLLLRCGFLVISATLLGCLAETDKEMGAEISMANDLLSKAQVGNRFSAVLQDVLLEFAQVFRSESVFEVVGQGTNGRTFKWEIPSLDAPAIRMKEISPSDRWCELLSAYPHTFFMRRTHGGSSIIALDEEGRRLDRSQLKHYDMPVPEADSVLVVGHEMGRDWTGRMVLLNVRLGPDREHELRFAQGVMHQIAPALYSVYLFRAYRSRAEASERARVARELHDGAIQALIGIEMQVDVLRRNSNGDASAELDRIQGLLRREVLNLRELMQSMRPVDIGPHQFLDFIAGLVERFCRDTGIAVRFISEMEEVTLPAATCSELVRVVQEGLVNIRKHSQAQSAVVRFGAQNGSWKLVINDDGKGFPFTGRLNMSQLDGIRRGPAVIKERVRAVGGDMVIESTPGQGSRLEITVPQKGFESYG